MIAVFGIASAPTASAHACTDGRCNKIWNVGGDGSGLWIYDRWDGYVSHVSFLLNYGAWTSWTTADVDGFYEAPGWCAHVYQSNDNSNYGDAGFWCADGQSGARAFLTQYWIYNEVHSYREPKCDVDC
jgi:hypothetical protein